MGVGDAGVVTLAARFELLRSGEGADVIEDELRGHCILSRTAPHEEAHPRIIVKHLYS